MPWRDRPAAAIVWIGCTGGVSICGSAVAGGDATAGAGVSGGAGVSSTVAAGAGVGAADDPLAGGGAGAGTCTVPSVRGPCSPVPIHTTSQVSAGVGELATSPMPLLASVPSAHFWTIGVMSNVHAPPVPRTPGALAADVSTSGRESNDAPFEPSAK